MTTLRRLALGALALALALTAAETAFRVARFDFHHQAARRAEVPIFYRQPTVPLGEVAFRRPGPAAWSGPVLRDGPPVTVRYDESGFRNPAELTDWEIVVVGDSMVESGYLPWEEILTTELGRRLGVRVKNLGTSYTGPRTHRTYLRAYGDAPSARAAVLAFFEGNDLEDLARELAAAHRFEASGVRERRVVRPRSSLIRALGARVRRVHGRQAESRLDRYWRANADLRLPSHPGVRVKVAYAPPPPAWLPARHLRALERALAGWAAEAREMGLEPWLLFVPCKHRVLHPWLELDSSAEARLRHWKPNKLPERVAELTREHGMGFVDPTAELASSAAAATDEAELPYNRVDSHLSARGSAIVAAALARALTEPPDATSR